MKKIFFLWILGLFFAGCFWDEPKPRVPQKPAGVLTKGTLNKIERVKGGYILHALIKNGNRYENARGMVNSLQTHSSEWVTSAVVSYEEGDLLGMQLKNGVIMYSEVMIKNYTTREGGVVRSANKRDKSKIKASLPQEKKIRF